MTKRLLWMLIYFITGIIIFNSCDKKVKTENESMCDNVISNYNKKNIKVLTYSTYAYSRDRGVLINSSFKHNNFPQMIIIDNFRNKENDNLINSLLNSFSFSQHYKNFLDSIVLMCLYSKRNFSDSVILNDISKILIYCIINHRTYALIFEKKDNASFLLDCHYSGITRSILYSDIYALAKSPQHASIVLISNYLRYKTLIESEKQYITDFQIKNSFLLKQNGGGVKCNDVPECKEETDLPCIFDEHPSGPTTASCGGAVRPILDECATEKTGSILASDYGIVNISFIIRTLYNTRDNFLSLYPKGWRYADDYYYLSEVLQDTLVSSDILHLLADLINQTNFFNNLREMNNPSSRNTILINTKEKNILLNIVNKLKTVSTDVGYQFILSQVEKDINLYAGKTIQEIKDDFSKSDF